MLPEIVELVRSTCGAAAVTSLFAPGAWDYAAGHALIRGAGGVLVDESGVEVTYAGDGVPQASSSKTQS